MSNPLEATEQVAGGLCVGKQSCPDYSRSDDGGQHIEFGCEQFTILFRDVEFDFLLFGNDSYLKAMSRR